MSPGLDPADVVFFRSATEFRRWLAQNHDRAPEAWVGFHKASSGRKGMTYTEAVDQALCFGWIDGIRKRLDDARYTSRFTPRRRGSFWSLVNTRRAQELQELGQMHPAGARAFEERDEARSRQYSYENWPTELGPELREEFESNAGAWAFFQAQPAGYRKTATFWVMQAKLEETRRRRLGQLIDVSADARRLPQVTSPLSRPRPAP